MSYRQRTLQLYEPRNFVLPTFPARAVPRSSVCQGCSLKHKCEHTKKGKRLGCLGQDDDTTLADWASGSGAGSSVESLPPGITPIVYGPNPTPATLQLNAAEGLAPGTAGTTQLPSPLQSAIAAIAGGATNIATSALSANAAAQNPLNQQVAGMPSGTTWGTIALWGGAAVIVILLISALKK